MRSQISGIQVPTGARLNVDGELTLDASAGTSGQALISQGSGNTPAWTSSPTFSTLTADQVLATNNGNGTNFKVGDDVWLGDINVANTMSLKGQQSATSGYIRFGGDANGFGYDGTKLSYAGNLTTSGLTLSSTTSPIILNASAGTSGQVLTSAGAGATPTWTNASGYTLPTATSTVLGGIELFSDTAQSVAANAVSTTASRTYGLQLNASGQGVINVPWSDTNTFPTTWAWTDGTTSGPTASITGTSSTISVAAVPAASATVSGIVTTGTQTFAGVKTLTSPAITTSLTSTSLSFDLVNTTATTVNFAGAATTLSIGNTATAAQTVNMFTASTGGGTYNFATGANTSLKTVNIGTNGVNPSDTVIRIGTNVQTAASTIYLQGQTYFGQSRTGTGTTSGYGAILGGSTTTVTGTTGNATGGDIQIISGSAIISNASNTAGASTSGNITIDSATSSHAYFDGTINTGTISIGTSSAASTTLGRSGANTTINGATTAVNGTTVNIGTTASSITTGSATTTVINTGDKPILKTGSFTVGAGEKNFNVTGTASVTVTLPTATAGRTINIVNKAAFTIVSASSNVYPRTTNTLGTAICAASAGSWATLVADGTNWYIMAGG